jgi:peptidyl-dipeptidase Dcp
MKKTFIAAALAMSFGLSAMAQTTNPLLERRFNTPHEIAPFSKITTDNYREAYLLGMKEAKKEIDAIVNNPEAPTFENTIVALDCSGSLLRRTAGVFGGLSRSCSTPEYQQLESELSPLLSAHSDYINMNEALFKRVKAVYDQQASLNLNTEQKRLLDKTYKGFVRGGALLDKAQKQRLSEINLQLAKLQLQFTQNLMHDTNQSYVTVDNISDLEGLSEGDIQKAAALAERTGAKGKYRFNMQRPSCNPVLQYAKNRELRRQVYEMYNNRCNHNDQYDNKAISAQIVALRLEEAKLMGYNTFADMQLETRMAKKPENVYNLLDQIWKPAVEAANRELGDIKEMMRKDGIKGEPKPWDYMYYLDKAKQEKFSISEAEVSQYLEINNVLKGIFWTATKLYGVTFRERTEDYPQYHKQQQSWDVIDENGHLIAIFYSDFFPRDGKGAGAWCGRFRPQSYDGTMRVQPIVTNVCNMTLPAEEGGPALQTVDNVLTMFHEFGHALHSFFSDVQYQGTGNVERDFVELPSQINEHWAFEPEVLRQYARHYKTGELMPQSLVDKLDASSKYGQGFATVEYLAASYVDLDLHVLTEMPKKLDVMKFQAEKMGKRGMPTQILPRYSVTNFSHTMGGGYSAGYYSYIWAEVLDADAFEAFKETGDIFNQEVAKRFREEILTPGGILPGDEMYRRFRGRDPKIDGLLKNRGFLSAHPSQKVSTEGKAGK